MSDLQHYQDKNLLRSSSAGGWSDQVALYDKYSSMAYGIILTILPDPKMAQEVLLNLFASSQLKACDNYPFSYAGCIIKLARSKALEAKQKVASLSVATQETEGEERLNSPENIFDLAFRKGLSLDLVAERLNISRQEVLKGIHLFFKTNRPS